MLDIDLALHGGVCVTMNRERAILRGGTVLIHDGRIVDIGTDEDLRGHYRAAENIDLAGALVHPGLVDAHAHIAWHLTRCWKRDAQDEEQLWHELEAPLISRITAQHERLGTALACAEMALHGTTTFCDTGSCFFLDEAIKGAELIGIRGVMGYLLADCNIEHNRLRLPTITCLSRIQEAMQAHPWDEAHRVGCATSLIGMGTASDELLTQAKRLANEHRVPLIMHEAFSTASVRESMKNHGNRRPIQRLHELGILDERTTLVHMNFIDQSEFALIHDAAPVIVHCPTASMMYGLGASRHCLFPEMLADGVPVALGSDSCHWGNNFSLWRSIYLAAALHREARDQSLVIPAQVALEMATLHGAKAVGLENHLGSLEVGKQADLVIHRTDRPELWPAMNIINNLVYGSTGGTIDAVLVQGKFVVRHGALVNLELKDLLEECQDAATDLAQRMNYSICG